ncbi:MAG: SAM-dependent methyltransferase [Alphaproteobacteria bacterium]|nr:SAM-dependent methyltransferase [Alphaproteobacteria bacterium]
MDCFYTKEPVARLCLARLRQTVDVSDHGLWVEPSAGAGAFFRNFPRPRLGIDILPSDDSEIIQSDFLFWRPDRRYDNIIVAGNPPFGKNASMAVRFFNHAASFAGRIAMILPRTFRKDSVVNRLNRKFHLDREWILPENSFEFNAHPYSVPTVFQVWTFSDKLREIRNPPKSHGHFSFVKQREQADFAVQRVGVAAGAVKTNMLKISPNSHYFLKAEADASRVLDAFREINWSSVKYDTAGNPSLSKSDVVGLYTEQVNGRDV